MVPRLTGTSPFLPLLKLQLSLLPLKLLISASEDKRLMMHDARGAGSGRAGSGAVASLVGHTSWVFDVDVSPDGRLAVSGYGLT